MNTFKDELIKKVQDSLYNNYGKGNFDEQRFGKFVPQQVDTKVKIKDLVKKIIRHKKEEIAEKKIRAFENYEDQLAYIWDHLNRESRKLWVDLVAYRILGCQKVKLPVNNSAYWDAQKKAASLRKGTETIDPHFLDFILQRYDLRPIHFDVELFFLDPGVAIDFIIEQYAYQVNGKYIFEAEKGDTVLDIGACWGDTALYFADKVGEKGKVYSFEFIPGNIEIYNRNMSLNPQFRSRIELVESPVSDISDQMIYYRDNGPGSQISTAPFDAQTGTSTTISVDDFAVRYGLPSVDFIKMDIEGAEQAALRGAVKTIKKYRPKLAIAIYHSMEDFVNIPKWLMDLDEDYEFFIGHYTIHAEETVIYAKPKNK